MKGGNPYKFGVKKLTLYLITLLCLSLAIWAWEKVPLLTTFLPPPEQFDSLFSMHSPVIPAITQTTTNLQLSTVNVPSDSSTKDVSLDLSKKEGPSQSADDGSFSVIARLAKKENFSVTSSSRSQERFDTQPIAPKHRSSSEQTKDEDKLNMIPTQNKECNYAKGKWVADSRRPLYSGFDCKRFLSSAWSCRLTKRTDFSFEKFRWQPEGCQMPEFEGSDFLKRMQHKTIAFVGDSLGRQQFQSLMCMVTGGRENLKIKDVAGEYGLALKPGARRPDGWVYRFPQTNTTILYYWSASLCELEPMNKTNPATTYAMHLDRPATFIKQHLDKFEVLVLNTGHHWNKGKFAANRWVVHANGKPVADGNLEIAKNHTVHSIVKWLDARLTERPRGMNVFFRTLSPRHFVNGDWNTGGSCDSTKPLSGGSEVKRDGSADPVAEDAVKGTRVKLLDITALSQLRDEGHMSNSVNPKGGYDCLHWCLPGIPDTWNEILAARI